MKEIDKETIYNFKKGEILHFDKPLHWSSFKLVKALRGVIHKEYNIKNFKVGHAGTLDPLATGVMTLCTGRATKLISMLQATEKEYVATIRLGATTPSFDLETQEDATYPIEHITEELVNETLKSFIGEIHQIPPVYSAVKVDGKRAYELARKGREVELKSKILHIEEIELQEYTQNEIKIRVVCSKGTYIRALARDIGEALNSGGYLTSLVRTRVGDITLDKCYTTEQIEQLVAQSTMDDEENK